MTTPDPTLDAIRDLTLRAEYEAAWLHFNKRVTGKTGDYGPFTNADWQAACAMARHAETLRAENTRLREALQNLLGVENKSWPSYVRQEFAAARAALASGHPTEETP